MIVGCQGERSEAEEGGHLNIARGGHAGKLVGRQENLETVHTYCMSVPMVCKGELNKNVGAYHTIWVAGCAVRGALFRAKAVALTLKAEIFLQRTQRTQP